MSFLVRSLPTLRVSTRRFLHSTSRSQSISAEFNSKSIAARQPGGVVENVIKEETETHSASYLSFLFFVVHPVGAATLLYGLREQGQGYGLGH